MENVSKALLMAGGVLIAIIILSLLVRSFTTIQEFQMSQLTEQEQKELITYNERYTRYLEQYVYGTELITVINGALDNTLYPIIVEVKFNDHYEYNGYQYNVATKRYEEKKIEIDKRTNYKF